jgi:hypothetical protein
LIVICGIGLLTLLSDSWVPIERRLFGHAQAPAGLLKIGAGLGYAACLSFAIFMLRGANWARWVYLGWVGIGTLSGAITASSWLLAVPGALKTVLFAYFLTRRDASAYFRSGAKETGEQTVAGDA